MDEPPRPEGGTVEEGTLLWAPSAERAGRSKIAGYMAWLAATGGPTTDSYEELWRWSVTHLEEFWASLWEYFGFGGRLSPQDVLVRGTGAEGARWFPGQRLNYVDVVLRQPPGDLALIAEDERAVATEHSYGELTALAGAVAAGLRNLGVGPGDRVAAVLPNGAAAVAAFLGSASLGAVWSTCAPEFGAHSMIDRFRQIDPTVLLVAEGYGYGGKRFGLADKARALRASLPGLKALVSVPAGTDTDPLGVDTMTWNELIATHRALEPVSLAFDHPLWILYSSGTTGPPKAIVHGHGGIVLEHLKALSLHHDLGPGDRFFWFSTTGWMMWNLLVGGLLVGATIVCFDGSPTWPGPGRLFDLAQRTGITLFGTSAPFLDALRRSGYRPVEHHRLGTLAAIGSTGAPLSPEGFAFAAREVAPDVQVASVSGGTDVCTAFIGACPLLPVRAGEIQCRMLGAAVAAFDEQGRSVVGEMGELVVTEPMPSMPLFFWGDADGARMHESYFSVYPGVWRHGDWMKVTESGACVVYGRSDATLNRGGVRSGAADFYRVLDGVEGISDSLVVDTSELGHEGRLYLFVVADPHASAGVADAAKRRLRDELSPRHVPDQVVAVGRIPRTLNGKKIEVPARRILLGTEPSAALTPGAVDDQEALASFVDLLVSLRDRGALSP